MNSIRNALVALVALVALTLALPGLALAQASTSHFVFNDPFETIITNPCNGESALVVGRIFFEHTATQDSSGGLHSTFHTHIMGSGPGDQGNHYVFVDHTVFSANDPSSGVTEQTASLMIDIIGKGQTTDYKLHVLVHVTITPAGEMTASVGNVVGGQCP